MLRCPGCSGWHGGPVSWLGDPSYGFVRGLGGMFSFAGSGGSYYLSWNGSVNSDRGVAVVGTGL